MIERMGRVVGVIVAASLIVLFLVLIWILIGLGVATAMSIWQTIPF